MIKVEIQSTNLRNLPFNDNKGDPVQEQSGWAFFYDRDGNMEVHPRAIGIRMNPNQKPYTEGVYFIHPQTLYCGDFGAVKAAATIKLIPQNEFGKFVNGLISKPVSVAA